MTLKLTNMTVDDATTLAIEAGVTALLGYPVFAYAGMCLILLVTIPLDVVGLPFHDMLGGWLDAGGFAFLFGTVPTIIVVGAALIIVLNFMHWLIK